MSETPTSASDRPTEADAMNAIAPGVGAAIYLDNHATTPVDQRVLDAMIAVLRDEPGNPSSASHVFGRRAKALVEAARSEVAQALGGSSDEVVFTSGATESLHLAIRGLAAAAERPGAQVLCFAADHSATQAAVQATAALGCRPGVIAVTDEGLPDLAALDSAIDAGRDAGGLLAIVVTAVHNELGVIADLPALAARAHAAGGYLIVDAAQAPGRIALDVDAWGADLVAVTAHKCYGPKGVGALWRRKRGRDVPLAPLISGGGQEGGLRAGTLATAQIVGLGRAMALAEAEREADTAAITALRDRFWAALSARTEAVACNGSRSARVAGNLNLRFAAIDAATLLVALPDLAISSGAACSSGARKPSATLLAIGLRREQALSSIRIGIGRMNTAAEVDRAANRIADEVQAQRAASPLWSLRHDAAALATLGWDAGALAEP